MRPPRWITSGIIALTLLVALPAVAAVSGGDGGVLSAAFLTGCTTAEVHAEPAPEITRVASVLQHTERERQLRDRQAQAAARQEARASGYTVDRVLEIALHPMFLLILAAPLLRRMRLR